MQEKTEKPTGKKLRDARKRGQVVKSKEVTETASFFVMVAAMLALVPWVWGRLERLLAFAFQKAVLESTTSFWSNVLVEMGRELLMLILPIALLVAGAAALASYLQTRGVWATDPVKIDFARLNLTDGLQRIFSTQNLFNLVKHLFAVLVIGAATGMLMMNSFDAVVRLLYVTPIEAARSGARMMLTLFVLVGFLFAALAAIDYGHQFYEFMKKMRMSKDDVKREHKDMEGDPHIKGERRRVMRELASSAPGAGTRQASVLVVNPTHYAVAVFYEAGVTELPLVLEKGVEQQALFLREVAREAGVPIFEYPLLARELYAKTPVFEHVPREMFAPIAEVLLWVRGMKVDARP